jgi:hypothetical protein
VTQSSDDFTRRDMKISRVDRILPSKTHTANDTRDTTHHTPHHTQREKDDRPLHQTTRHALQPKCQLLQRQHLTTAHPAPTQRRTRVATAVPRGIPASSLRPRC